MSADKTHPDKHLVSNVFLLYKDFGGYLKDPKNIEQAGLNDPNSKDPPKATEDTLKQLLQNVLDEVEAFNKIQKFDIGSIHNAIDDSYNHVASEIHKLEGEQAAEDIAKAVASAAQIALVASEWSFFAAIGLGIAAIAATATESVMEHEVQSLQTNIINDISKMGEKSLGNPEFDVTLKTYTSASDRVTLALPIWNQGGDKSVNRMALQALAHTEKSLDKMVEKLISIHEMFIPEQMELKCLQYAAAIVEDNRPSQEQIIKDVNTALMQQGTAHLIEMYVGNVAKLTITSGLVAEKSAKAAADAIKQVFEEENIGAFSSIEGIGEAVDLSTRAEYAAKAVKGLAVMGGVLDAAFQIFNIVEQREVIDKLFHEAEHVKNALYTYFDDIHSSVQDDPSAL